jgi:hypothetical protein
VKRRRGWETGSMRWLRRLWTVAAFLCLGFVTLAPAAVAQGADGPDGDPRRPDSIPLRAAVQASRPPEGARVGPAGTSGANPSQRTTVSRPAVLVTAGKRP